MPSVRSIITVLLIFFTNSVVVTILSVIQMFIAVSQIALCSVGISHYQEYWNTEEGYSVDPQSHLQLIFVSGIWAGMFLLWISVIGLVSSLIKCKRVTLFFFFALHIAMIAVLATTCGYIAAFATGLKLNDFNRYHDYGPRRNQDIPDYFALGAKGTGVLGAGIGLYVLTILIGAIQYSVTFSVVRQPLAGLHSSKGRKLSEENLVSEAKH